MVSPPSRVDTSPLVDALFRTSDSEEFENIFDLIGSIQDRSPFACRMYESGESAMFLSAKSFEALETVIKDMVEEEETLKKRKLVFLPPTTNDDDLSEKIPDPKEIVEEEGSSGPNARKRPKSGGLRGKNPIPRASCGVRTISHARRGCPSTTTDGGGCPGSDGGEGGADGVSIYYGFPEEFHPLPPAMFCPFP